MKSRLLLATALTALSFQALAADLPKRTVTPTAPAPIFSWTGAYAGITLGAIVGSQKAGDIDYYDDSTTRFGGAAGGVTLGYNFQAGNLVYGVEADYSFTSASWEKDWISSGEISRNDSRLNGFGTVRARIGALVTPTTLLYVTGGLAVGTVAFNGYHNVDSTPERSKFSGFKFGWTAGAGIEQALGNNLSVKLEALYLDLGKVKGNDNGSCQFGFKTSSAVVRAGLNFKF